MRGINLLHPKAQQRANQLVQACAVAGLNVIITDTLRTVEEQNALFARGRDADGFVIGPTVTRCYGSYFESPHQWGVAFDFCRNDKSRAFDNSDGFFEKVGAVGKRVGLFWGGDFRGFMDMPHFELPEFLPDNSTDTLLRKYRSPAAFIQEWRVLAEYKILVESLYYHRIIADKAYWLSVLNGERAPDEGYLAELFRRVSSRLERR